MLAGGYFHGVHNTSYGVDLESIRWCGVLQVRPAFQIYDVFYRIIRDWTCSNEDSEASIEEQYYY